MSDRPSFNLHHVHVFASNLDLSLAFYARWFGARVVWDAPYAGSRNVFVQIGVGRLHFYDQPPRGEGRNAFHHLGIQVDALDALYERMRDDGVPLRQPVKRSADGAYLMVEAPDGVLLELFEPASERRDALPGYYV
ncbi:VOC family protein [Aquabacterium sp. J223]|uniref:VOC family protein n=1 Tax=Aquabacterium sp. J223 TaxID=2898431 RepID=UPI0021AE2203|nr:VOC family protein [Aquabacterium sp. J223]UUX93993.1 VOC family protein [Aquabacterium sp. J223]